MTAASHAEIARAAERLRRGGLVAFPTETVYGLGADTLNASAVDRVFVLKGRPSNNPLIVHVADVEMARRLSSEWTDETQRLAQHFWPGPLTIVVPKSSIVPDRVTAGGATVALRQPDHPVALSLLHEFAGPLVGPSANPSGATSPTLAAHVRDAFADAVARDELLVLDGGPCRAGIESTVVSLAGPRVIMLRRGIVSPDAISGLLGRPVEIQDVTASTDAPLPSPGMLDRHYAPRSPARLFDPIDWPDVLDARDGVAVVISHARSRVVHPPHVLLRMPLDAEAYAAALFATLHEADAHRPAIILIESPQGVGAVWDAVRDRLRRACHSVG